jgi:hypothetical protein
MPDVDVTGVANHRKADMTAALVHRAMNDRRQKLAPNTRGSLRCECECHRVECASNFYVSAESYAHVRAQPSSFIVAPGHERPREPVVSTTSGYLVVSRDSERVAVV